MEPIYINGVKCLVYEEEGFIKYVNESWDAKKNEEFPGPQPISIERKHFEHIKSEKYVVSNKNDGVRYILCFIKYKEKNICCLIDRNLKCYLINVSCNVQCFTGTILDCEMVKNKLIMFDCIMINGANLKTKDFFTRMDGCETLIKSITKSPFEMEVKKFVDFKDIDKLSKIDSDGLIIMPVNKSIIQGTHNYMYKWKPKLKNTIDFLVKEKEIYLQNNGELKKMKVYLDFNNFILNYEVIVECEYVKEKHWKVINLRPDKNIPNSKYTYSRTLTNISEDIKPNELEILSHKV
tara:strand:+ start:25 stop:903 length:879 start_codon:yes stop_codon:yes gene_type:complete